MKDSKFQKILDKEKIMVIDGSMSTALEHLGCNLKDKLWTAKALTTRPDLVKRVHIDYFKAGADCGITCSYQATIPGLMNSGYGLEESENIIKNAVKIFIEARDEWWKAEGEAQGRAWPLCLGAVGPYGAYLADGSEYRGNYGISNDELEKFHRRRMELLLEAGADILLIETIPSLNEALLAASIAEELGAEYWISFSCKDGKHICEGDMIKTCAEKLSDGHPNLCAIGVNCTSPIYIEELIGELKQATTLPIAVYPNSGEVYNALTKTWHGNPDAKPFAEYAALYMKAGAKAVGGCCTTVASHIESVRDARKCFLENI